MQEVRLVQPWACPAVYSLTSHHKWPHSCWWDPRQQIYIFITFYLNKEIQWWHSRNIFITLTNIRKYIYDIYRCSFIKVSSTSNFLRSFRKTLVVKYTANWSINQKLLNLHVKSSIILFWGGCECAWQT